MDCRSSSRNLSTEFSLVVLISRKESFVFLRWEGPSILCYFTKWSFRAYFCFKDRFGLIFRSDPFALQILQFSPSAGQPSTFIFFHNFLYSTFLAPAIISASGEHPTVFFIYSDLNIFFAEHLLYELLHQFSCGTRTSRMIKWVANYLGYI